jgi:hypothetical protein
MVKKCKVCGKEKPVTQEHFYIYKGRPSPRCKPCIIKYVCAKQKERRLKAGENQYYVYEWYFIDTGKPFYVGKGKGRRFKETRDRSEVFRNYIKKYKCASRIIISGLTEREAYEKEIETISVYRNQGINLINKTPGGDAPPKLMGLKSPNRKAVIQLSLDGRFIRKWDVLSDAEKELGIANNAIVRSCKNKSRSGRKPSAGGYLWVYEEDYDPAEPIKYKPGTVAKPILQYSLDGKLIREWESAKQAANELGLQRGTLCSCLKGKYFTCGGYQWRYKLGDAPEQIPPININDHHMQIAINRIKNKKRRTKEGA